MPADPVQTSRAALFDHDEHAGQAQSGRASRRRPPAPDWGGDDLFDHVPRRRFVHAAGGEDPRRSGPASAHAPRRAAAAAAPRASAPKSGAALPEPVQELIAARRAEYEPAPTTGRRTVRVTGHPGALTAPRTAGPARGRGPRTVEERIGARPDRVAAWAVALGMVSSVVALLS